MTESTLIAYVKDNNGIPVGRIRAEDDIDGGEVWHPNETFGKSYGLSIRTISTHHNAVSDLYYDGGDTGIRYAYERFVSDGEFDREDGIDTFFRYMRIFHPLVPVIYASYTTGYCQGDSEEVIMWTEPTKESRTETESPIYVWATEQRKMMESHADVLAAHYRGQYITTIYEEMGVIEATHEDESNISLVVDWDERDSIGGTLYLDEFSPEKDALEVARDYFELPEGTTLHPAF